MTRPYPNVVPPRKGTRKWEARYPSAGKQVTLGFFDNPESAYRAVLHAQADNLDSKARTYRARAESITEADRYTIARAAGEWAGQ